MVPNDALWVSETGLVVPNVEVELILNVPFRNMAASGEFGDRPRSSATLKSKSKSKSKNTRIKKMEMKERTRTIGGAGVLQVTGRR